MTRPGPGPKWRRMPGRWRAAGPGAGGRHRPGELEDPTETALAGFHFHLVKPIDAAGAAPGDQRPQVPLPRRAGAAERLAARPGIERGDRHDPAGESGNAKRRWGFPATGSRPRGAHNTHGTRTIDRGDTQSREEARCLAAYVPPPSGIPRHADISPVTHFVRSPAARDLGDAHNDRVGLLLVGHRPGG